MQVVFSLKLLANWFWNQFAARYVFRFWTNHKLYFMAGIDSPTSNCPICEFVYWQKIMLRSGESYFRDVAFQGRRNVCKGFLQLRSLLWMLAK